MFNVVLKSVTLAVSVYIFHKGINPPTPPPAKEHVVYKGQLFEYMSRSLIYWWQVNLPLSSYTVRRLTETRSSLHSPQSFVTSR